MPADATRRRFLRGAAVLAGAAVAGAACGAPRAQPGPAAGVAPATAGTTAASAPTAAPAAVAVKLGLQNNANDVGFHLAAERGYFAREGLDVELVPFSNASEMVPSLATDQLQVSSAGANPALLNAVARDVRFKMVLGKGSFRPGYGFMALVIRGELWSQGRGRSLEALRGLRVAITPPGKATTSAIPLDVALRRVSMTLDDLDVVPLPFPEMVAALSNGAVDGAIAQEPAVTRVVQDGTAVKLMGVDEMYPDYTLSVVCYSPTFYANRPAAKGFARAYVQALREYNTALARPPGDPLRREVHALIASFTRIPLATVEQMTPVGLSPNGGFNVQSVLDSYAFFLREGLLAQALSDAQLQGMLGTDVLDEVLDELGRVPEELTRAEERAMPTDLPAIDADGHICERESDVRKYLEPPWNRRATAYRPFDQPWDTSLFGALGQNAAHLALDPADEVATWLRTMDEHDMEYAVLFPTGSGNVAKLREVDFATALARATNDMFAAEYNRHSPRVQVVGVLPMQDPAAAAAELRRAVTERGLIGFEVATLGLPYGLGDPVYDPVWAEAARLGVPLCIHADRQGAAMVGGDRLGTFGELHCYAMPAGILLHFTSVLWNAVPLRFPGLKLAFLEIGVSWLPYYLDRLDEHWEKRGEVEAPHLTKKPSALFREASIYVSLECEEGLLADTIDYVGDDRFLFASDIPHWDSEFPKNLVELREHPRLSRASKEKLLYHNARALFGLTAR